MSGINRNRCPLSPDYAQDYPYARFALSLAARGYQRTASEVKVEVDEILRRLRATKPGWVDPNIDGRTEHLIRHGGLDNRWQDEDGDRSLEVEEGPSDVLAGEARAVLRAAARSTAAGKPAERSLHEAIEAQFGRSAVALVRADGPTWQALLRDVRRLAVELANDPAA